MIEAHKRPGFEAVFRLYNRHYLLRRHFHSLTVLGDVDPVESRPAVYVMNHCSWWDGLLVYEAVSRLSARAHFMMMEEQQLAKYAFFRKIGAFSIRKTSPSGIRDSLQYARGLLEQGHSVWIFPQGDIEHIDKRPLGFHSGTGLLLALCPYALAVPVSLYLMFGLHQKPEASLRFGEPLALDWAALGRKAAVQALEDAVTDQLERQRAQAIAGEPTQLAGDATALLRPGRSVSDTFDRWFGRSNGGRGRGVAP
ncbi:lysophospholipid acyltransferase family protein [Paenibacillus athensensis]|uniref:Phospholipid/glycerol acyltransferase domain-containing protein n=1 Tax=Paenibacillus athensensis TaxID=1967502 RepID=A0A4Y8Q1W3_9BACL|nr:lysophospholipid acyltransferase family protein [Paenibacillus athensensis]MCD1261026.1 lysophospholipid acyltransferase family protein [Paenibacillus athensensis]